MITLEMSARVPRFCAVGASWRIRLNDSTMLAGSWLINPAVTAAGLPKTTYRMCKSRDCFLRYYSCFTKFGGDIDFVAYICDPCVHGLLSIHYASLSDVHNIIVYVAYLGL